MMERNIILVHIAYNNTLKKLLDQIKE